MAIEAVSTKWYKRRGDIDYRRTTIDVLGIDDYVQLSLSQDSVDDIGMVRCNVRLSHAEATLLGSMLLRMATCE
jgi:hypothetical protein